MALDLSGATKFPISDLVTINNSTVIEIKLPIMGGKINLSSEDGAFRAYFCDGLSEGDTPSGSDGYQFCAQDNLLCVNLTSGSYRRSSCYVKFKTTATGTLCVLVEGRG